MIIKTLKLENFKSYKNSTIDFDQGISLILGENGSGKSSILEAISFALFGKLNTKLDEAIRKPINDEDTIEKMSVTLTFKHNGKTYKIKRQRKSNKTTVSLHDISDEKPFLLSKTADGVKEEVNNILNIDYDSFQNAVYIKQGEITKLTEATPAEKKKLIAKLLNIETLEKAYDNIQKIIKQYEDTLQYNKGELSRYEEKQENKKQTQQQIKQLKDEHDKLENEITKTQQQIKTYKEKLQKLETQKDEYNTINTDIQHKQKELIKTSNQIEDLTKTIQQIEDEEKKIKEIETKIQPLEDLRKADKAHSELKNQQTQLTPITQQITEIQKNEQILKNTKDDYEKYNKLQTQQKQLQQTREKLNEEVNQNNIKKAEIENLKQRRDTLQKQLQNNIINAVSKFHISFTTMSEIKEYLADKIEKSAENYHKLNEQIQKNKTIITTNQNLIESTKKSLEDLKNTTDTCPICQSEITHQKHEQLEAQYKKQIENYEQQNTKLSLENAKLNQKLENEEKLNNELFDFDLKLNTDDEKEFNTLKDEYKQRKTECPKIQQKQDEYNKCKEDLKNIQIQIDQLKENYESYKISTQVIENAPNLDILIQKQQNINNNINQQKLIVHEITMKHKIRDNLKHQITYLESLKDEQNRLKGKVTNKDTMIKQQQLFKDQHKNITLTMDDFKNRLIKLDYDKIQHEQIMKLYDDINHKNNEYEKQLSVNEKEIELNKQTLNKINSEIEELDKIKQETQSAQDYIKVLDIIRQTYSKDGVQSDLREEVKPQIERNTMNIFQEFGFDYSSVNLDRDYNITVKSHNEDLNLDQLSGGERIVIALALRLAIAKTIAKSSMELLILDEPTIHLDSERRSSLLEIISRINLVPQMIVVTHDDEMEALSNNIIKVKKENAISSIEN